MAVYSEETLSIPVGAGLDTYNHPARLEPGFTPVATNVVARRDRLETRAAFIPPLEYAEVGGDVAVSGSVETKAPYTNEIGDNNYYSAIPNYINPDWPGLIYSAGSEVWAGRQFNRDDPTATDYATPYVRQFTNMTNFKGACTYLDKIYVLEDSAISAITAWDWATGLVTKSAIDTAPLRARGLFVFKDRMWTFNEDKIFYTDVPTSPGAYPEVWGDNFIVIGAQAGLGKIQQIIPVGTALFVFTESGFYTVSIIGSPANWVVRTIDGSVCVDSPNCAVEYKGLVFFTDSRGIWATDGTTPKEVSGRIKNLFNVKSEIVLHKYKLVPLDDGLIFFRSSILRNGTLSTGEMYFTPIDYIAWTKFELDGSVDFYDVIGGFSQVQLSKPWNANNFLAVATQGLVGGMSPTVELKLFYPYVVDQFDNEGTPGTYQSFVKAVVHTAITVYREHDSKRALYGYLNLSTDVSEEVNINYRWSTENQQDKVNETITPDMISYREGMIKVKAPEFFRHVQLELEMTNTAEITTYQLLGASINIQSHRKTPRDVS